MKVPSVVSAELSKGLPVLFVFNFPNLLQTSSDATRIVIQAFTSDFMTCVSPWYDPHG